MCAHTRTCAMCVRKALWNMRAMCVRATIFQVCEVQSQFSTFFSKKDQNFSFPHCFLQVLGQKIQELSIPTMFSMLFHGLIVPEFKLVISIHKKSENFSFKNLLLLKRACASAPWILEKRTRACDVRAAENWTVRCACVRAGNPSQLIVWNYPQNKVKISLKSFRNSLFFFIQVAASEHSWWLPATLGFFPKDRACLGPVVT